MLCLEILNAIRSHYIGSPSVFGFCKLKFIFGNIVKMPNWKIFTEQVQSDRLAFVSEIFLDQNDHDNIHTALGEA